MKLELKNIAPYLWNGLQFIANDHSDILSDIWADSENGLKGLFSSYYDAGDKDAIELKNSPITINDYYYTEEEGDFLLGSGQNSIGYPIDDIYLSEVKPLLRPMSDLTKEIKHNGERFVPIVELLKTALGYEDEGIFYTNNEIELTSIEDRNIDYEPPCYVVSYKSSLDQNHSLSYKKGDFTHIWRDGFSARGLVLENQQRMRDQLAEWHFNYMNLDESLWIPKK